MRRTARYGPSERGRQWITARTVNVEIQMETVFKGQHARQPKAYLSGFGVVRSDDRGNVTIANV